MKNEIKILCPGRKCRKCRRMLNRMEEAVEQSGSDANITIVDSLEEILQHPTWILPTLVINNKVIARGYVPDLKTVIDHLKTISNPKPTENPKNPAL